MARADAQSHIMERLLEDPAFRARFRRDPVGVAREEGDDALANELASIGDPMQTLDFRESRSSVAGVMMAAAVEGLGIYELGRQVFGHIEEAQAAPVPASSAGAPPAVEPSGNSAGPPLADPANAGAALDDEDSDSDAEGSDSEEEDSD